MSKATAMGAVVKYCGHDACFLADIFEIEGVKVVRANFNPKSAQDFVDKLYLQKKHIIGKATHHLSDCPNPGFWRPDLGVFVVPKKQVTELK